MSKKENIKIAIFNLLVVLSIFTVIFGKNFLFSGLFKKNDGGLESCYGSKIIPFFFEKSNIIVIIAFFVLGIFNIIFCTKNRNRKIFFWMISFALLQIYSGIRLSYLYIKYSNFYDLIFFNHNIFTYFNLLFLNLIPVIIIIINIKNKDKRKIINIFLYIIIFIVIIIGMLNFSPVLWELICWELICIIMQLKFAVTQDELIDNNDNKNGFNYYILFFYVLSFIFIITVLYSMFYTKINKTFFNFLVKKIFDEISNLDDVTVNDIYIPVENNSKYGFIDEQGNEVISCKYDRVSYFFNAQINNKKCYFALVKKDNDYFIISKNEDNIHIDDTFLQRFFYLIENDEKEVIKEAVKQDAIGAETITKFSTSSQEVYEMFGNSHIGISIQEIDDLDCKDEVELEKKGNKLYYKNTNYTLVLQQLNGDEIENLGISYENNIFNVTLIYPDGNKISNIEIIPSYSESHEKYILTLYDKQLLQFKNINEEIYGYYDENGNRVLIGKDYSILAAYNNYILLSNYNNKQELDYILIDKNGDILIESEVIGLFNNFILCKNDGKMVLYDYSFNNVLNKYDNIIIHTNSTIYFDYEQ